MVDPSSIHHYILWSDQCYHRVHMMVEVQWYGNSDELLLSHQQHFVSPMIHVEHQPSVGNLCKHFLHDPFVKHMFGRKKWVPLIHVHLMQVAAMNLRKVCFVSLGIIPNRSCIRTKYPKPFFLNFFASRSWKPRNFFVLGFWGVWKCLTGFP